MTPYTLRYRTTAPFKPGLALIFSSWGIGVPTATAGNVTWSRSRWVTIGVQHDQPSRKRDGKANWRAAAPGAKLCADRPTDDRARAFDGPATHRILRRKYIGAHTSESFSGSVGHCWIGGDPLGGLLSGAAPAETLMLHLAYLGSGLTLSPSEWVPVSARWFSSVVAGIYVAADRYIAQLGASLMADFLKLARASRAQSRLLAVAVVCFPHCSLGARLKLGLAPTDNFTRDASGADRIPLWRKG